MRKCLWCDITVCLWGWEECWESVGNYLFFKSPRIVVWEAPKLRKSAASVLLRVKGGNRYVNAGFLTHQPLLRTPSLVSSKKMDDIEFSVVSGSKRCFDAKWNEHVYLDSLFFTLYFLFCSGVPPYEIKFWCNFIRSPTARWASCAILHSWSLCFSLWRRKGVSSSNEKHEMHFYRGFPKLWLNGQPCLLYYSYNPEVWLNVFFN